MGVTGPAGAGKGLVRRFGLAALVSLLWSGAPGVAASAVPVEVPYFGHLSFESGAPYQGAVNITMSVYTTPDGGAAVWGPHTFVDVGVEDGRLVVVLGGADSAPLDAALLEGGALWLDIALAGHPMSPRQRLLAVPYARVAHNALELGGLPPSAFAPAHAPAITGDASVGGSLSAGAVVSAGGVQVGDTSADCTPELAGTLRFAAGQFEGCDGSEWMPLVALPPPGQSPLTPGLSCKRLLDDGHSVGSGQYWIQPSPSVPATEVYCDMTLDGGGWTLVAQRNQYGSFNASFATAVHHLDGLGQYTPDTDVSAPRMSSFDVNAFMNTTGSTTLRVVRRHPSGASSLDFTWSQRTQDLINQSTAARIFWVTSRYWCTGNGTNCRGHGGLFDGWDISASTSTNQWLTYYPGNFMIATPGSTAVDYGQPGVAWIFLWAR